MTESAPWVRGGDRGRTGMDGKLNIAGARHLGEGRAGLRKR